MPKRYRSGPRRLRDEEARLIREMAKCALFDRHEGLCGDLERRWVRDLNDGGMGSIRFCDSKQRFGKVLIDVSYVDDDGMDILIGLILNDEGGLYELDMMKGDSSPLLRFPALEEIVWGNVWGRKTDSS